ncbi:cation diffusion facilitator family transporter [Miltoncostaea oceani]|uniref:cation diffusion facilitator family transporter n=1 Tax=Miltoncostaea oceani TaxID=2843216 RepID=UPI001FE75111|nr:cation diffusion facilitator family transporter [Miltoncostaea oceani]
MDPAIASSERGLWALKWSVVGLGVTAALQVVIVVVTGSVALLADTVHNIGDALSAVPLAIAFVLSRRPPSARFPFGLHRSEDLAGLVIIGLILFSAVFAAYESIRRLFDPQDVQLLWAVALAGVIGFLGNEAVAIFRIRVGRQIGSAALIADGYHARTDGLTSLAVVAGAIGVALGWPAADPVVGLLISAVIMKIVWDASKSIGERLLDGVDPAVGEQIRRIAAGTEGVDGLRGVRARWQGHVIRAEIDAEIDGGIDVAEGHRISERVAERLRDEVEFFGEAIVRTAPAERASP